jgi:hypothetical protein
LQLERKEPAFHLFTKPALAGILALLLVLSSALSSSPALHQLLHTDYSPNNHVCLVCLLAQGQVSGTAPAAIPALFVFGLILLLPALRMTVLPGFDHRLFFSRAPPRPFLLPVR